MEYLKEPLRDISISRPTDRVSWAIPTPDDDTQTVYVWLDALVNYLTSAGYPNPNVTNIDTIVYVCEIIDNIKIVFRQLATTIACDW